MVDLEPVLSEGEQDARIERDLWHLGATDEALLRRLIGEHARYTASTRAREILDNWTQYRARFVKVFPKEYRRALNELAAKHKKIAA